MVEQRFGIGTLAFALLTALGCSSGSGGGTSCTPWTWDGGSDSGSTMVGGLVGLCNDPRCPATFAASRSLCFSDGGSVPGVACSMIGFQCWYPGAGDGSGNALVECSALEADGSAGTWVCAQ